jgi:signal transduction histidine kinase
VRRAWRWRIGFLGIACLVVLLLGMGGWRLISQERSLSREQTRERLENAASLIIRESERALARTAAGDSLSLAWDDRGLRRTAGVPLLWSPLPAVGRQAPNDIFAVAERIEFGAHDPARAMGEYRALLDNKDRAVRAGAIVRIARCQRTLGQINDALRTYEQLTALSETPAGGAPAELVALRERSALLEERRSPDAARERDRLRAALEDGRYSLDRTTFAFYAQAVSITENARVWAEAANEFWNRARDYARGAEVISVRGRHYAAEWSREGSRGTGRLVDIAAVPGAVGDAVRLPGLRWQFLDARGTSVAGTEPESRGNRLLKRAGETGLPWAVLVSLTEEPGTARVSPVVPALVLSGIAILAALFLAHRAVQRQLHVARMQSEFVAAVSHEFRTPITALTHLTEMLETGGAPDERKPAYYAALSCETGRLREMVEALLDFGRIESGRYRYNTEQLDLVEFVRTLVDEFRQHPGASSHEVVFEADEQPPPVSADRATLRRAVWNLLDNAAKYSPPGKRVVAQVHAVGDCAGVTVQDEGPGIADNEQKTIFQKFVRGTAARNADVKGTGIGLAMVDAIARAHGGRVELRSHPGEGSRFTILLPIEARH